MGLAAPLAMAGAVTVPAMSASASPRPAASCAWPAEDTAATANRFAPDSSAAYWVQPFAVTSGLRIVVSGRYPDARYASFTVYKSGGGVFTADGVNSWLTDYQIAPDPGSVNPWQGPDRPSGGQFTVTVRSGVSAGAANTLPLAPSGTAPGTAGYLVFRVYLPAGGDFSAVELPDLTLDQDGRSVTLDPCGQPGTSAASGLPAASGLAAASGAPASAADTADRPAGFARPAAGGGVFPNPVTGYLRAVVTPPAAGQVVVISGQAPASPSGNHPSAWPAPAEDVRYWSMCDYLALPGRPLVVNQLPGGTTDYGCRPDQATTLNAQGYYTYVVGTEAQRAAIEKIPGVTFLPFSTAHPATPSVLLLRNMLASDGFSQAVQNVPQDGNPASAQAVMGSYYPREAVCALSTLQASGPRACLSAS
jgi:hypothetical protein